MLENFVIGFIVVGATIIIHATGAYFVMKVLVWHHSGHVDLWMSRRRWWIFVFTAITLLALHTLEIMLWAGAYWWLPQVTGLESPEEAIYFSMVTFTTLGYGDVTLPPSSRLLSGIEAMSGILLFGWSTALFFSVVQHSWKSIVNHKRS